MLHFAPDVLRLRLMNATYWLVSARSVPGTKSVPLHMCACANVSRTFFFFFKHCLFLHLSYVLLLLFKVPYTSLFSCVLKNALFERILKFRARFFRVLISNAIERPAGLFNMSHYCVTLQSTVIYNGGLIAHVYIVARMWF